MSSAWTKFRARGRAKFDFAAGGPYQLSLQAGDDVDIYEQSSGWYKGQLRKNGSKGNGKKGIFPANYIEIWHKSSRPSTSLKTMKIKEDEVLDTTGADEKGAISSVDIDRNSEESLIQESAKMASKWNKELREHLKSGVSRDKAVSLRASKRSDHAARSLYFPHSDKRSTTS